ncbi:MAG: ribosome biogenesis GTPase Der [Pirellulales bacterium]|nr:ribosome biogenesis GTPase Der [Pirellulales bacterium]
MSVPSVAIVGRPNVGKSSLFNWLAGRRLAIVDNQAGVTRDRVAQLICVGDRYFELVDTGGMGLEDQDNLTAHVEEQIQTAIDSADLLLFVVDTRQGLTPLDQEVSKRLRYVKQPVLCVANKTDGPEHESSADEFYRLGRGKLIKVSALANRGRNELLDEILRRLPPERNEPPADPVMKVAIVGRRNTGKSTFVNTLAKAERMIVSEIPGTTRDSVDVRFELDGKPFMAIDTPGLRRTKSLASDIEFYSSHRAQRSIRRADVVLLFFDAGQRISKVDKQLCDYIAKQYKPCIFVVNKWDLLADTMPTEKWANYLRDTFRTMWYAPIAFVTGQTGKNVKALINHAQMLFKQSLERVSTADLNKLVHAAVEHNQPPMVANRRPRIYYATQVAVQPPTVVLFTNFPSGFSPPYQRYLLGVFREHLPFGEVPIKLYLRKRAESSGERDEAPEPETYNEPDESSESVLD